MVVCLTHSFPKYFLASPVQFLRRIELCQYQLNTLSSIIHKFTRFYSNLLILLEVCDTIAEAAHLGIYIDPSIVQYLVCVIAQPSAGCLHNPPRLLSTHQKVIAHSIA